MEFFIKNVLIINYPGKKYLKYKKGDLPKAEEFSKKFLSQIVSGLKANTNLVFIFLNPKLFNISSKALLYFFQLRSFFNRRAT